MDVKKKTEEAEDGPWEAIRVKTVAENNGKEKRTRRQRKSSVVVVQDELQRGDEVKHGKVLRSHTRRNTEKTAAAEWVSSKQQQSQHQRPSLKRDVGTKPYLHADDEGERRKVTVEGGGTAEIASVISLSSSCQQSPNEKKVPQQQAELGGTTSKAKLTIEDATHLQTGSSSTFKGSTIGEVGRASKSKRNNKASLLQCSSHSEENMSISLVQSSSAISQHSKTSSIVGTAGNADGSSGDDTHSLGKICSAEECKREEEMSYENVQRSPKESACLSTTRKEIDTGKQGPRFESTATGGSESCRWSPPATTSDQSEQDEEKEEVFRQRFNQDDDEEELASSLKTLACSGQSETNFEGNQKNSNVSVTVCNSFAEVKSELAGKEKESSSGQVGEKPQHQRNDDDGGEWQVAPHNNEEGKCVERNLRERERSRSLLPACRRPDSSMIQGGIESTPTGTEAPCAEVAHSSPSPQSPASEYSFNLSKKKTCVPSVPSKKRSVSERVCETPPVFKFKKPQQNKKCNVRDNDNKSDSAVHSGETQVVGEVLHNVVVQPKKTQMSSVQISNLPYMGELTFDTRPRRGRKPKKADICHLISKNYGIHFPSAAQDTHLIPTRETTPRPPSTSATSTRTKLEQSSTRSRQAATRGSSSSSQHNASPSSSTQQQPLLLPSNVPAFCNRDVSIVPILSSLWNTNAASSSSTQLSSRAEFIDNISHSQFMLHRNVIQGTSSQETISMFPLNPAVRDERGGKQALSSPRRDSSIAGNGDAGTVMEVDQGDSAEKEDRDQDMPLNLCLRDDTGGKGSFLESLSLSNLKPALDVRWGKGVSIRINPEDATSASMECKSAFNSISPSITIIQGGKRSIALSPLKETIGMKSSSCGGVQKKPTNTSGSNPANLVSGGGISGNLLRSTSTSSGAKKITTMRGVQPQINTSEISVSLKNAPQEDLSLLSFSHRIDNPLTVGSQDGSVSVVKQTSSKKKKEMAIRPGVSSPACPPPKGSMSYSTAPSTTSTPMSALGGRLFGQSSGGINDGAEVSICKFKFTGGAKPSLQEKKMLSVDSGGNFRFYTDKTNNGMTTKLSKGHQFAVSPTSKMKNSEPGASMGKLGLINELSFRSETQPASSSLIQDSNKSLPPSGSYTEGEFRPKSRKGTGGSSFIKSGSKRTMHNSPSISSSSTSGTSQTEPFSSLPTREESKYFRLSLDGDQIPTTSNSSTFPFQVGEDTNSSSNSCTSSDDSNENSQERGNDYELLTERGFSQRNFQKHSSSSSEKMKLRRKRRTRKSLMREKLEKTFKEKGFLIQTQQLESAEGATYCKFRQLRKFTRYLFRSWKDYLPDNVKEISDNSAQAQGKGMESQPQANIKSEGKEATSTQEGDGLEEAGKSVSEDDLPEDEIDVEEDPDEGDDEEGEDEDDKGA